MNGLCVGTSVGGPEGDDEKGEFAGDGEDDVVEPEATTGVYGEPVAVVERCRCLVSESADLIRCESTGPGADETALEVVEVGEVVEVEVVLVEVEVASVGPSGGETGTERGEWRGDGAGEVLADAGCEALHVRRDTRARSPAEPLTHGADAGCACTCARPSHSSCAILSWRLRRSR